MNTNGKTQWNRRQWLQASAGAALATGLWPGCARWADGGQGGAFDFVVLNDTHYQNDKCAAWFARVRASILTHHPRPEFCLAVGDLSDHGQSAELASMRDVLRSFGMDFHAVIGNHDYATPADRSAWEQVFPRSLNYTFEHRGWQFVGLDSTEGNLYQQTHVQSPTLDWLDRSLTKLRPGAPMVLFTHFPLGPNVKYRPLNADDVLARFREINLVAVLDGHFHGFTERRVGHTTLTTNRCCAISRSNHDGTTERGYFLCSARDGQITRQFVEVKPV